MCRRMLKRIRHYLKQVNIQDVSYYYFDEQFYLNKYPSVARSRLSAYEHFMEKGWKEGKDPNGWFSTKKYLKNHSDVKLKGLNPFAHYLKYGLAEGRETAVKVVETSPSVIVKNNDYLKLRKDFQDKWIKYVSEL